MATLTTALVALGAVAVGDGLRRAVDPRPDDWTASMLVGLVWGLAGLLGVSALLGLLGRFDRATLTLAMVVAALAAQAWARVRAVPSGGAADAADSSDLAADGAVSRVRSSPSPLVVGVAVFAVIVVGVLWAGATVETLRRGILDNDAQHYHLTHAARYAQTGHVFDVHFVSAGDLSAYHPSNDELLRAAGMVTSRTELPGLAVNWVAAALVLLAAAVAGRHTGRTAALLLIAVSVLAEPLLGPLYGGTAANDHLAIGLLAGGLALAMTTRRVGGVVTAGVAVGLAMGTKLTVLVPGAVALLAFPMVRPAAVRWRDTAAFVAPAVAFGSWWYLRNWVHAGNPVPGMDLPLGPLAFPEPTAPFLDLLSASVLSYLDDPTVVVDWLVPGLVDALGWLWPLHLLLVAGAVVLGIRAARARSWTLLLGLVTAAGALAYLATPTGAAGLPGRPYLFALNLRYLLPAVLLGGWVVARWLPPRWALRLGASLALSTLLPALWVARTSRIAALLGLVVAVALAAVAGRWVAGRSDPPSAVRSWVVPATVLAGVAVVAALGGPLRAPYLAGRYDHGPSRVELFRALDHRSGLTVGVVGKPFQYGYTGRLLGNRVEYVGRETDDHGFVDHETCPALLAALAAGAYDYVAVAEDGGRVVPPVNSWLGRSPQAFQREVAVQEGVLYRVAATPDPSTCAP